MRKVSFFLSYRYLSFFLSYRYLSLEGRHEDVLQLFAGMDRYGVEKDMLSFHYPIQACCALGDPDTGLEWLRTSRTLGGVPDKLQAEMWWHSELELHMLRRDWATVGSIYSAEGVTTCERDEKDSCRDNFASYISSNFKEKVGVAVVAALIINAEREKARSLLDEMAHASAQWTVDTNLKIATTNKKPFEELKRDVKHRLWMKLIRTGLQQDLEPVLEMALNEELDMLIFRDVFRQTRSFAHSTSACTFFLRLFSTDERWAKPWGSRADGRDDRMYLIAKGTSLLWDNDAWVHVLDVAELCRERGLELSPLNKAENRVPIPIPIPYPYPYP
jgi:hypothetical protein